MIRQIGFAFLILGNVTASAADSDASRVDSIIREQDKSKSQKTSGPKTFVLGNTELRVDPPGQKPGATTVQPAVPSQAAVTLRQPINENAALSLSNEFGSQKTNDSYSLNRKEIWALDWTRSAWNGQAYSESQGAVNDQDLFTSQQTAHGVRTGTKIFSGTNLSAEIRQENNKVTSGAAEREIYQTQLSQKIANLPFTLEFTPGVEQESGLDGDALSHSTRFNNALLWQANANTRVTFGSGLKSKDYSDATREEALLYYSQFDTTLKKDVTFSLRSDYQDLTRNSAGLSSYQEQKVNIQIGPRFRLPENFTASFDMRYGYTQQNGSPTPGASEQALALSIQGKF